MAAPPAQSPSRPGPLRGIRVLDFTAMLAGPHCTRLMADLGINTVRTYTAPRRSRVI